MPPSRSARRRLLPWSLLLAGALTSSPGAGADAAAPPKRVTRVRIVKSAHALELWAGAEPLASYVASMGPGGSGPKLQEGDRVTPVGRYRVTMHQASAYRVFLRLDYPNAEDHQRFARLLRDGRLPAGARIGGDIGIHGPPLSLEKADQAALRGRDWTLGCIAVTDDEIQEIARLVPDGTVVDIED